MTFSRFKSRLLRCALYVLVSATMVGCAAPIALLADPDKDILLPRIKPAGFKLTSITIVWIDNPSIPITFGYMVPKYQKDRPAPPELINRREDEARTLINVLRTGIPVDLLASLEKSGVRRGSDYRIEMKPISVNHYDSNLGMRVHIDVKVLNREGERVWRTLIDANRGYRIIGLGLGNQDNTYIEKTIEMLLTHMRKAELLT